MNKKPIFEWDGYTKKTGLKDKLIIYFVWIITLLLIIGMGILINNRIKTKKIKNNIIISGKLTKEIEETKEIITKTVENTIVPTNKIKLENIEKETPEKVTYSLRLKKIFSTFTEANKEAIEYLNLNFNVYIIPSENGDYYIELEQLENKKDALELKNTLIQSNIEVNVVKSSKNYILPQQDIEKQLQNLIYLSTTESIENTIIKTEETNIQNITETSKKTKEISIVKTNLQKISKKTEEINEKNNIIQASITPKKETIAKTSEVKTIPEKIIKNKEIKHKNKKVIYTLQAGAYREESGAINLKKFLEKMLNTKSFIKKINGLYKVFIGEFSNYKEAKKYLNSIPILTFDGSQVGFFITKVKNN